VVPKDGGNGNREETPFNYFPEGTAISKYQIIKRIGSGGMGDVYLAKNTELNRLTALKFLQRQYSSDKDIKTRFRREAQAAAKLDNPNIITVYETGEYHGQPYLAMQFIQGQPLIEFVKGKKLGLKGIIDLTIQICQGFVHRDIKPGNIMVDKEGRIKILDFGLAKAVGVSMLTRDGAMLGTAGYMSPEQVKGTELDKRSDIFSTGVIFFEMLTGALPFDNQHLAAAVYSILNEEPKPIATYNPDLPIGLQSIIDKVLAKSVDKRYQDISDFMMDLKQLNKELELADPASEITRSFRSISFPKKHLKWIIASSLIVILLIVVSSKLWIIKSKYEPIRNSLAVLYFENLSDRDDRELLGEIVADAVTCDLNQTRFFNIISRQRLYDILRLLSGEGFERIDHNSATRIAQKARAEYMVMGKIFQSGYETVLTSQIINVASGNLVGSPRVSGDLEAGVLTMVCDLATEIRKDLDSSYSAETDSVDFILTDSTEAYKYYLKGRQAYFKLYWEEAEDLYKKAIEIDSTFAMAYYGLALLNLRKGHPQLEEYISNAMRYSEKTGYMEKVLIKSLESVVSKDYDKAIKDLNESYNAFEEGTQDYFCLKKEAYYWMAFFYKSRLNQPEKAIEYFNKVLEIDSLHKATYNELVYTYKQLGDLEKSFWAANRQIEIAPSEANPYDTKGDLYRDNNMLTKAIESYEKAIKIKPDFYNTLSKLGHIFILEGSYSKAESCYQRLVSSSEIGRRTEGRTCLALIPMYRGKFKEALEILDIGIAADRMEQVEDQQTSNKHFIKTLILEEIGDYENALVEMNIFMEILSRLYPGSPYDGRFYLVKLLAEAGKYELASEMAEELRGDIERMYVSFMPIYWFAKGNLEFFENKKITSNEYFLETGKLPGFWAHYYLGVYYFENEEIEESISEFESLHTKYGRDRLIWGIQSVKSHYYLGMAYEISGWNDKAIGQYNIFLNIWNDADPGFKEIDDARNHLEGLEQASTNNR
jgi:serine/threonine protein kinase